MIKFESSWTEGLIIGGSACEEGHPRRWTGQGSPCSRRAGHVRRNLPAGPGGSLREAELQADPGAAGNVEAARQAAGVDDPFRQGGARAFGSRAVLWSQSTRTFGRHSGEPRRPNAKVNL
jgi:hypothetical protein